MGKVFDKEVCRLVWKCSYKTQGYVMHELKGAILDNKQVSISTTVRQKWIKIAIFKTLHESCIAFEQIKNEKL